MLVFGFVLVIFPGLVYCDPCVTSDQVIHNPKAPSLAIRTIPDDSKVMLVGHNFSVACTSNSSKEYESEREDAMPYQISMFHGVNLVKACGSEDDVKKDTKTCVLDITNASVESSGNYSCMAVNDMLRCTITTILVIVKAPSPPNITIYPLDGQMMVASRSYFNLNCEATGVPPPKVTWFKDGSQVMLNSSIKDDRGTSVITFMSVRPENRGHYWCEANNTEGWIQSSSIFLTVLWKPYFESNPQDVWIYEGDNVTLSCSAVGSPTPVIGWLKDNVSISNFSAGGNASLVLPLAKRGTSDGKYRCVAENSLGKTYSLEGTLTVLSRQITRDNASSKSEIFNPVWAWLGAVVAILLVSTSVVFVRKYRHTKHSSGDGGNSYISQSVEVVTGYARF